MTRSIVAKNAKSIILRTGLKQKVIAERMNMSDRKLSDILNGRKIIDDVIVLLLCRALEVTPNDLFGYNKNAYKKWLW